MLSKPFLCQVDGSFGDLNSGHFHAMIEKRNSISSIAKSRNQYMFETLFLEQFCDRNGRVNRFRSPHLMFIPEVLFPEFCHILILLRIIVQQSKSNTKQFDSAFVILFCQSIFYRLRRYVKISYQLNFLTIDISAMVDFRPCLSSMISIMSSNSCSSRSVISL